MAYISYIGRMHFETMIRRRHSYENSIDARHQTRVYPYPKAVTGFFILTKNDIPGTHGNHLSGMPSNLLGLYMEIPRAQNKVPATGRKNELLICTAHTGFLWI